MAYNQMNTLQDLRQPDANMQSVIREDDAEHSSESEDGPYLFTGMPRLHVEICDSKPVIVSYQNDYLDFLDENNLIDTDQAKQEEKRNKAAAEAKNRADANAMPDPLAADGEDLCLDDIEDPENQEGVHRFDHMIKSMMARLEIYNSLAPIQEYGRH